MSSQEPTAEQVVEAVYQYAVEQMISGVPNPEIERNLIDQGLDAESARTVVSNLQQARSEALAKAGSQNMLHGALWCIGGITVTALTYLAAATNPAGGTYIIAYGAIVFGGIQFFRGLAQAIGQLQKAPNLSQE